MELPKNVSVYVGNKRHRGTFPDALVDRLPDVLKPKQSGATSPGAPGVKKDRTNRSE